VRTALVSLLVWGAALSFAEPARAQSPSTYEIDLRIDLPVVGLASAGALLFFVEVPPPPCLRGCPTSAINALDRPLAGSYSPTAHTIADFTVLGALLVPPLLDLAITGANVAWLEDTFVFAEAILVTQAITQLTKFAVHRTAPFVYGDEAPDDERTGADASRSFFSGHTATAFSAAATFATTFWLAHPRSRWRWVVAAAGVVLGTAVALLKVEAGYHFWTDVLAGALVGTSIGVLVPVLHARASPSGN